MTEGYIRGAFLDGVMVFRVAHYRVFRAIGNWDSYSLRHIVLSVVLNALAAAPAMTIVRGVETGVTNHAYTKSHRRHANKADKQDDGKVMVATHLGGWLVLVPWITPSLFHRFLDMRAGMDDGPAMDSYSLCESLVPVEGNKLMRAHFDSWITEDHIACLVARKVECSAYPSGMGRSSPMVPMRAGLYA